MIFICEYGGVDMSVSFRFHFGFETVTTTNHFLGSEEISLLLSG